jgi:hypothetical protein
VTGRLTFQTGGPQLRSNFCTVRGAEGAYDADFIFMQRVQVASGDFLATTCNISSCWAIARSLLALLGGRMSLPLAFLPQVAP